MPRLVQFVAIALLPLLVSGARAQTPDAGERAKRLLAQYADGRHTQVSCADLDLSVGRALIEAGDDAPSVSRAIDAYRLAERAGTCAQSDALVGAALNGLAGALQTHGDNAEAIRTGETSITIHERLHDQAGIARAWNIIGNAHWWQEDMSQALADYQRSLDHATAAGDRSLQARVFNNVANIRRFFGQYSEALGSYSRALAIFDELGDRTRAAVVTDNIGLVYGYRGDFRIELEYAERALAIRRELGDPYYTGKSLDSVGQAYLSLGNYAAALNAFEQALQARLSVDDRAGAVETTHNLGLVHFAQGDDGLAIEAFKRAIDLNRRWNVQDTSLVAEALRNIGAAAWRLGQHDRAAADFRESLAIAEKSGTPYRQAQLLHDLGQMALSTGHLEDASRLLDRSLAISETIGDQAGVTDVLTSLAGARLAARQYPAALVIAERAAANATAHDQPDLKWRAETVKGVALRRLGRTGEARQSLGDAIRSVEALAETTIGFESLRQRFFEDKLAPYHELLAQMIDERAFGEAFELAERSKARVLTQLLAASRDDRLRGVSADETRERDKRRDAIAACDRQIDRALEQKSNNAAELTQLEASRSEAREALANFEITLAANHPDAAAAHQRIAPVTVADAGRALAGANSIVIEYVVSDRGVFGLAVTTDGRDVRIDGRVLPISATKLAEMTAHFRSQIAGRDFSVTETAGSLYTSLLAPFTRPLAGRTQLIVIPDGVLWTLPFQALVGPSGYVIETMSVSYAPSIAALREIERLPKFTGERSVLALGKSTFGSRDLAPLPAAEAQVRQIGNVYGRSRSAIFVGDQATESRFTGDAPHYSVLHLATHGVLDEASPLYSHLILTPSPDGKDDGRLNAQDIMRLKLNADLVVLAACDTGRGRIAPGEGVIGMMWALFVAGARSVVVSQFPVESASTTKLLMGFHQQVASGAGVKAAQLRAAALNLLHAPASAHPYYWAGFMLVGDPE